MNLRIDNMWEQKSLCLYFEKKEFYILIWLLRQKQKYCSTKIDKNRNSNDGFAHFASANSVCVNKDKITNTDTAGVNKDKNFEDWLGNIAINRMSKNVWKLLNKIKKSEVFMIIINRKNSKLSKKTPVINFL